MDPMRRSSSTPGTETTIPWAYQIEPMTAAHTPSDNATTPERNSEGWRRKTAGNWGESLIRTFIDFISWQRPCHGRAGADGSDPRSESGYSTPVTTILCQLFTAAVNSALFRSESHDAVGACGFEHWDAARGGRSEAQCDSGRHVGERVERIDTEQDE